MTPPISAVINGILFALSFWAGLWLVQIAVLTAMRVAASRRIWFVARSFSWPVRMLFGSVFGGSLVFQSLAFALRDAGKVEAARAMALARIAEPDVPSRSRNAAIDLLISAGAYEAALRAEPQPYTPANSSDALGLTLIQVNLAEAEYNLGRWDAAEERLRPLDLACGAFDIARAGLLQQRAWISAQRGRGDEALDLCARVKPKWLPRTYRAEYHFTRAAALLACRRLDEADWAVVQGEKVARRLSSKRNALFLRARVAAARDDWNAVERLCRAAADHRFRAQGGDGLLLWAEALEKLGREAEAIQVRGLVRERDPESEAARLASARP
jgi:hypothetical protein